MALYPAYCIGPDRYKVQPPLGGGTYADEDYMGRLAQVAKACLRARGMVRVGEAFIFRWRNRMNLLWRARV